MPFMSAFALTAPSGLIAPGASADTIHVTDTYTVAAGDTLDLDGSPGFKLEAKSDADVSLDIEGTVTLQGGIDRDKLVGIVTTQSINGTADIHIGASGTLSVTLTGSGQAMGALMATDGGSFDNEGSVRVTGADGAFTLGVIINAAHATFSNEGDIQVFATGGTLLGVIAGLNVQPDDIVLTNAGSIEVENSGGLAYAFGTESNGGSIDNHGTVTVRAAQAIGLLTSVNGSASNSGLIEAFGIGGGGAVGADVASSLGFTNAGVIRASGPGGALGAWMLGGGVLDNDGSIITESDGQSAGVYNATNSPVGVVNHGLIRGQYAIVSQDALGSFSTVSADTVTNSGKLIGDVVLGGDDDSVVNTGRIHGDIDLGDGEDVLDTSHGQFEGQALGGLGDDDITGSAGADTLYGDALDDGLGGGDDLLRGMKGEDSLVGGQGDDTLLGGAGVDDLRGGLGDDVFKFTKLSDSVGAARDVIFDLTNTDQIDLHLIDAETAPGGDQAFHLVGAFSGQAGELTLAYDGGTGMTTISGDVDGDGTADLVITAAGDHHDFTNFVL